MTTAPREEITVEELTNIMIAARNRFDNPTAIATLFKVEEVCRRALSQAGGERERDTRPDLARLDTPQSVPDTSVMDDEITRRQNESIKGTRQTWPSLPDAPLSQGEELVRELRSNPCQNFGKPRPKNFRQVSNRNCQDDASCECAKRERCAASIASLLAERDKLKAQVAHFADGQIYAQKQASDWRETASKLSSDNAQLVERVSVLEAGLVEIISAFDSNLSTKEIIDKARAALIRQAQHDPHDRQSEGGE